MLHPKPPLYADLLALYTTLPDVLHCCRNNYTGHLEVVANQEHKYGSQWAAFTVDLPLKVALLIMQRQKTSRCLVQPSGIPYVHSENWTRSFVTQTEGNAPDVWPLYCREPDAQILHSFSIDLWTLLEGWMCISGCCWSRSLQRCLVGSGSSDFEKLITPVQWPLGLHMESLRLVSFFHIHP